MAKITLESLGRFVAEKRGEQGIRAAAQEIGISPATLSRVERGNLPDLETFSKICRWLQIDPGLILGINDTVVERPSVSVHFRKPDAVGLETAKDLAEMILAAQRALLAQQGSRH